jgi:hypothetical protein
MQKRGLKKPATAKRTNLVKATAKPPRAATREAQAKAPFVEGLLARGEAAELDGEGKLPLKATHVITKQNPDGSTQVKRVRFKAF